MMRIPRISYGFRLDAEMDERMKPGYGRLLVSLVFARAFPWIVNEKTAAALAMTDSIREAADWLYECDEAHLPGDCPLCGAE